MRLQILLPALVFAALQSCSKANVPEPEKPVTPPIVIPPVTPPTQPDILRSANYNLALLDQTKLFTLVPTVTLLQNQQYDELSGLVASSVYPGILYTHEDSGGNSEIYITNSKGIDLGKITLDGVYNRDWEDIAYGPGPDPSKKYIYVAEIGDNDAKYPSITVYRFIEPSINTTVINDIHIIPEKLNFLYPKGAVNAESLLLDPLTKDLYIASKERDKSILYVARYPQSSSATTTLTALAQFPFDLLTAGDISPDGSELLIRNTGQIWYWKREANESIVDMMLRKPQDAPYATNERQGESICFDPVNKGYYTTSETKKYPGTAVALSFYNRK